MISTKFRKLLLLLMTLFIVAGCNVNVGDDDDSGIENPNPDDDDDDIVDPCESAECVGLETCNPANGACECPFDNMNDDCNTCADGYVNTSGNESSSDTGTYTCEPRRVFDDSLFTAAIPVGPEDSGVLESELWRVTYDAGSVDREVWLVILDVIMANAKLPDLPATGGTPLNQLYGANILVLEKDREYLDNNMSFNEVPLQKRVKLTLLSKFGTIIHETEEGGELEVMDTELTPEGSEAMIQDCSRFFPYDHKPVVAVQKRMVADDIIEFDVTVNDEGNETFISTDSIVFDGISPREIGVGLYRATLNPGSYNVTVTVCDRNESEGTDSFQFDIIEPDLCAGNTCNDDLFCNGEETCEASTGNCLPGAPPVCDNGIFCDGEEVCDEISDSCVNGSAVNCDDGNVCNGNEVCDLLLDSCQNGTPLTCDNGDICDGTESCDAIFGCISGTALTCDNGNVCDGTETCDSIAGCQSGSALICDDGLSCNGTESCDSALGCQAGIPVDCNNGICVNPAGTCSCDTGYDGASCDTCDTNYSGYPSCAPWLVSLTLYPTAVTLMPDTATSVTLSSCNSLSECTDVLCPEENWTVTGDAGTFDDMNVFTAASTDSTFGQAWCSIDGVDSNECDVEVVAPLPTITGLAIDCSGPPLPGWCGAGYEYPVTWSFDNANSFSSNRELISGNISLGTLNPENGSLSGTSNTISYTLGDIGGVPSIIRLTITVTNQFGQKASTYIDVDHW